MCKRRLGEHNEGAMTVATRRTLIYRIHAAKRMLQRGISSAHIEHVVEVCEVIETYPEDTPFASRLVLGTLGSKAIHVVLADEPDTDRTYVITAYYPDPNQWDEEFRRRKP